MSATLEQMEYDKAEELIERLHASYVYPEPLPYPSTDGYEVEYLDIDVVRPEHWIPACGGTELPFIVAGVTWQYMWCPETGQHAYLNLDTDIFETDRDFHPCNPTG